MNPIKLFTTYLKRGAYVPLLVTVAAMSLNGCIGDLLDPTQVRNPQITDENLTGQPNSTTAALQGMRGRFADVIDQTAYFTDVVSDNYDNVSTFISPQADLVNQIRSDDLTLNGVGSLYTATQYLRSQANFALTKIVPNDPIQTTAPAAIAEITFYRGMASLVQAENFSYISIAEGTAPISSSQLLDLAIADISAAFSAAGVTTTIKTSAQYALARAYRLKGNKAAAKTAAAAAIALNPDFILLASYDAVTTGPPGTNTAWVFAVQRALNDIQPLPRLDFLDPKYTNNTGISPIAALKTEEAYLILAEAALSDNDSVTAKANLKSAISLARGTTNGRTVVNFADVDPRSNAAGARPNGDTVLVKADANSPARAGLVKRRSGNTVAVKQLSNTSVTTANVDTLTTMADILWMVYLVRQEVFFFEGRRMSDLGIRLPMQQREIEASVITAAPISSGNPGTLVVVPTYVPTTPSDQIDKFTTSAATATITITVDMNRVIATNRATSVPFTMPF